MTTIFLADNFSLDESGYLGRVYANRGILKSLFRCSGIGTILTTSNRSLFEESGIDSSYIDKLVVLHSLQDLEASFSRYNVRAVISSDFVSSYADWIDYRNRRNLGFSVLGFTHSLSYQRFTSNIYQILTAGPARGDTILCTSGSAVDVMTRLFKRVQATINMQCSPPCLRPFPLPVDGDETSGVRQTNPFRVLYMGRFDWQTKCDLLVMKSVIRDLTERDDVQFTIAGAADNRSYLELLRHELEPEGVEIIINPDEETKNRLYSRSHILFSPSDNYQETFGLTVLEAMHSGCVPLVTDFDGYRDLVSSGKDGILLKTIAAGPGPELMRSLNIVNEPTCHGWWAGGVSFDPASAAGEISRLCRNRGIWEDLSQAAIQKASYFSIDSTAERFLDLLNDMAETRPDISGAHTEYPYKWDMLEIFKTHPSELWDDQNITITEHGEAYLKNPYVLPQFSLMSHTVTSEDIRKAIFLLRRGHRIAECRDRGVMGIHLSIALKNGLIALK